MTHGQWVSTAVLLLVSGGVVRSQGDPASGAGDAIGTPKRSPVQLLDVWFPRRIAQEGLGAQGGWLPICIELQAEGSIPATVTLEVRAESVDESKATGEYPFTWRRDVEVSPGASRREWFYVRSLPQRSHRIGLRVLVGDEAVIDVNVGQTDPPLGDSAQQLTTALYVGTNLLQPLPLPSWFVRQGYRQALCFDQCEAGQLPDDIIGYQAIDVLVVRDFGGDRLEAEQLSALRQWVALGGVLIFTVSEGRGALVRGRIAQEFLGERYRDPRTEALTVLEEIRRASGTLRPNDPVQGDYSESILVDARKSREWKNVEIIDPVQGDGAQEIYSAAPRERSSAQRRSSLRKVDDLPEGRHRLYVEVPYGVGRVGVLTFDDSAALKANAGSMLREIWTGVLSTVERSSRAHILANTAVALRPDLVDVLKDSTRDIGFPFIVGLVVVYIALVGPGLFLALKRINRLPWITWLQPLVVCLYLGVILLAGYVSKGAITKARQWTMLTQRRGEAVALKESYLAIFSGGIADYAVSSPRGTLLRPIFPNEEAMQPTVLHDLPDGGTQLRNLHLDQWEEGYVVNSGTLALQGDGIEVEVATPSDPEAPSRGGPGAAPADGFGGRTRLAVRLTNRLPHNVKGGVYRHRRGTFILPPIAAGESIDVDLDPAQPDDEPAHDWVASLPRALRSMQGMHVLTALLERNDVDYDREWNSNLRERLDLYLLYR